MLTVSVTRYVECSAGWQYHYLAGPAFNSSGEAHLQTAGGGKVIALTVYLDGQRCGSVYGIRIFLEMNFY